MVKVPVMVSEGKTLACSGKDGGERRHRETRVQVMITQGRIKKMEVVSLKSVQRRDVRDNVATFQRVKFANVATLKPTSRRSRG